MAFIEMSMYSDSLCMDTNVNVLLPEIRRGKTPFEPDRKYPVIYCLHGHGDDQTAYIRKSMIEIYTRDLPVIVVMPTTHRGSYVDGKYNYRYYTFLTEELPVRIANYFPASVKREDTFIMGNSMGGYGAFRLAMGRPDLYAAAVSLSGAIGERKDDRPMLKNTYDAEKLQYMNFGDYDEYINSDNDLNTLALKLDKYEGEKPRLRHVCGVDDKLTYQSGLDFMKFVKENTSLDIDYEEGPGGHNWGFWNPQIKKAIAFFGFGDFDYKY